MKRILFVDDEPNVLEGLKNLLRKFRKEWQMSFACGGQEAMAMIETAGFNVIVTDMRMPVIDGATLLRFVQERSPSTVRIVLSGQMEEEAARRIVFVAHQFLAKPCDPDHLREVIERSCALQAMLSEDRLKSLVGSIGQLPAMPVVFSSLLRALENPNVSLKEVAMIVQQDPAISAKTLQIVNSAFFGLPRRMANVEQAVCYLGIEVIKGLSLMIEVFQAPAPLGRGPGFDLEAEQAHALATARLARRLVTDTSEVQDAFTAAMLHDCGRLIIATRLPEIRSRVLEEAHRSQRPAHVVEVEIQGVSHAEIGAYLLGLWGLPLPVVEAVAHHHSPSRVTQNRLGVLGAVHVADCLVNELLPGGSQCEPLDMPYVDSLGLGPRLEEWRAMASKQLGALQNA